jgi:hypothetical protein
LFSGHIVKASPAKIRSVLKALISSGASAGNPEQILSVPDPRKMLPLMSGMPAWEKDGLDVGAGSVPELQPKTPARARQASVREERMHTPPDRRITAEVCTGE